MSEPAGTTPVSPLDYFTGEIRKPSLGFRYRLGMGVVCAAMVVLPLIYLVLVAAFALGTVWYAVAGLALFSEPGLAPIKIVLYLGPLASGLVMVLFLLKPVFARASGHPHTVSLSHEEQPELFQFLGRLCQLVNAPPPSRVDVSCEVNASAGFREGFGSMWGNDLVLTIGLPLTAGLSAREFAGLIAHELGHFAQDGAMRSGYLVETINGWFARVVYERDEWDFWLTEVSREGGTFLSLVSLLARAGVWCSRRVLFCLMFGGVAISRYLSRQMEFNADNYAAQVAGSEAAAGMLHQFNLLGVASQGAYKNLNQLWRQKKLVDDFSTLVLSERERLSEETRGRVKDWAMKSEARWFSTHPSDAERIAAIERLAEPGIFVLEQPASGLFRDFGALSRAVTRHHYEKENRLHLNENNYKPVKEAIAEREAVVSNRQILEDYAPGAGSIWWPVVLDPAYVGAPADASQTRAALESVRAQVAESREAVIELAKALVEAENRTIHLVSAKTLVEAGVVFEPGHFGVGEGSVAAIERALAAKKAEIDSLQAQLADCRERYGTRFMAAAQLLYDPAIAGRLPGAEAKQEEVLRLVTVLAKIQKVSEPLRDIGRRLAQLQNLYHRVTDKTDPVRVDRVTTPIFRELGRRASAIRTELLGAIYPFEHASGKIALNDFCRPEETGGNESHQNYLAAAAWIQRLPGIYSESLARLAALAAETEEAAGIGLSDRCSGIGEDPVEMG